MLQTTIKDADLYIGRNAGKQIIQSIRSARKSIKIVSPYVSSDYLDMLLDKHHAGISVSLITSTEIDDGHGSKGMYKKVINQNRHTDERIKIKRDKGMKYMVASIIISAAIGATGLYFGYHSSMWVWALIPILFFAYKYFENLTIYSYTYSTPFRFSSIVSPRTGGFQNENYLPHTKAYLIDSKVAFLGSVNFTKSAFRFNYESCIKLTDSKNLKELLGEFEYLIRNYKTNYLDINYMGSKIYPEPKN